MNKLLNRKLLLLVCFVLIGQVQSTRIGLTHQMLPEDNRLLKEAIKKNGLETYYYRALAFAPSPTGIRERDGDATETSSCDVVGRVPRNLLDTSQRRFYSKYTEAYGIPVLGSKSVSDSALSRACYVLRFVLADRSDLRQAYYKSHGRVVVIADSQELTDIPEYRFLKDVSTVIEESNTRGLAAVPLVPISTAPEENIICASQNSTNRIRYFDDILLKSLAIGVMNIAVVKVDSDQKTELERLYQRAMSSEWWTNTDAARDPASYFGEGVQSFFDANAYADPADGHHNGINTRTKLRSYDSHLYAFILAVFPCSNNYLKRCNSRGNEAYQNLDMNCPPTRWVQ